MPPAPWLLARWVSALVLFFKFSHAGLWMFNFGQLFQNSYDYRNECDLFWCLKLSSGGADAFIFAHLGDHFGSLGRPGGPREQQKEHPGVRSQILNDFSLISGLTW